MTPAPVQKHLVDVRGTASARCSCGWRQTTATRAEAWLAAWQHREAAFGELHRPKAGRMISTLNAQDSL